MRGAYEKNLLKQLQCFSCQAIPKVLTAATAGELYGITLYGGILSAALSTKYVFAGIPQSFDFSNIDGIRKYYINSLQDMGRIIEMIKKNTALFRAGE